MYVFHKKTFIRESIWNVTGTILQNVLISVFFIVLAREYNQAVLGHYIIANTLYTMVLGFSTLGLGNWFIRELLKKENNSHITEKFFKTQLLIGIVFYIFNVIISFLLYENHTIRILSIIIGFNIILDNLIYVVKYINIAQQQQKRTAIITIIESTLKCLLAVWVMYQHLPIWVIAILLVIFRLISLNVFIRYGSFTGTTIQTIMQTKIQQLELKEIIGKNWLFVAIGSISVLYWSIGNLFISKNLSWLDVTHYEISYKLLAIAYMLPIVAASSLYPMLIKAFQQGKNELKTLYERTLIPFMLYGLLAFTFVASYSSTFIPLIFGSRYSQTAQYCTEMFYVMLVFPIAYFQANVLVTIHLEKIDMICNVFSLLIHVSICFIGLRVSPTLSLVNYSIFISFIFFRSIQDWVLIKNKISTLKNTLLHYLAIGTCLTGYYTLRFIIPKEVAFIAWWGMVGLGLLILYIKKIKPFAPGMITMEG